MLDFWAKSHQSSQLPNKFEGKPCILLPRRGHKVPKTRLARSETVKMTAFVVVFLLFAAAQTCSCFRSSIHIRAKGDLQYHCPPSIQQPRSLSKSTAQFSSIAIDSSVPHTRLWQIKGKLVNFYGALLGATVFAVGTALLPVIWLATLFSEINGEGKVKTD